MKRSTGAGAGGPRPARPGTGAAAGVLAAVILLYFAPVLAGRIALPFDMLYHIDPAFRGVAGAPPTPEPLNIVSGWDRVYQFHPWFLHNVRSLRRGEIPLWNPHVGAGSPHLALDITAVLDPLSTGAGLIVGGERAGTARMVLSVLVAALGMLVLMRSRGASAAAGVLASLSFAFGGWFVLWGGRPLTAAAAWLPWMLWATTRLVRHRRPARDGGLLAGFVALCLLAGHIATTAHALLLTGALLVYDAVRQRTGPRAMTAATGAGLGYIALGLLLAAVALLPFLEFLLGEAGGVGIRAGPPQSLGGRLLEGLGGRVSAQAVSGTLLTALVPVLNFAGAQRFTSPPPSLAEVTIYVGVVPLLLAGYALARSRSMERWFWAATAVAALALALRLPVFHLANRLSIIGWTNPDRLRLVWTLSVAVLAGLGLDALSGARARPRGRAGLLALLLLIPAAWTAWLLAGADADALRRGLAGITAGILALVAWELLPPARLRLALVALAGLELAAALHGVQPTLRPETVFPRPPMVAFLDSVGGEGRVAPLPVGAMRPLAGSLVTAYEIDSVEGYNVLHSSRLRSLYAAANGDIRWAGAAGRDWLTLDDPTSPLVDLLGARWLLTAAIGDPAVIRGAGIPARFPRLAWTDGHAAVWENPDPMPRAFVVREVSDEGDDGPARLLSPDFDFRRRALVDRPVALPEASAAAAPARVALRRESSGGIVVDVAQDVPGLLVVTESWDPGWRATVDGEAAEVVIADVAFLGVVVPAGRHEVRFRYAPGSFRWGLLATLLTAGALIAAVLLERAVKRATTAGLLVVGAALQVACGGGPTPWSAAGPPGLQEQVSGTTELLQAVSVVDENVVWVSGHGGTYARTTDGGATWRAAAVPGADSLQFRDVHALDARTAWLLAAGTGDLSRIYRTDDAGATWTLQWTNPEPEGFYDCLDFWDRRRGVAYGDAVGGTLRILITDDGGGSWRLVPGDALPPALPGEAGFAASGLCVETGPNGRAWIAAGNASTSRVFLTDDYGRSWRAVAAPVEAGEGAGLTAVSMVDLRRGFVFGGILHAPDERTRNAARTEDGGESWAPLPPLSFPGAAYGGVVVPGTGGRGLVAVGPGGAAASVDGAESWITLDDRSWWAVGSGGPRSTWITGPDGRIARLAW